MDPSAARASPQPRPSDDPSDLRFCGAAAGDRERAAELKTEPLLVAARSGVSGDEPWWTAWATGERLSIDDAIARAWTALGAGRPATALRAAGQVAV